MIKYENQCVGCPPEIGCKDNCPYLHVPVLICDGCECECGNLYEYGDAQLCEDCVRELEEEIELDELEEVKIPPWSETERI